MRRYRVALQNNRISHSRDVRILSRDLLAIPLPLRENGPAVLLVRLRQQALELHRRSALVAGHLLDLKSTESGFLTRICLTH